VSLKVRILSDFAVFKQHYSELVLTGLAVQMVCQSNRPCNQAILGTFSALLSWGHALPRAVPRCGQKLEGQRSQRLWRYTEMLSARFGRLHAHC